MEKRKKAKDNQNRVSRRDFIKTAAFTASAFTIVPRYVLGGKDYTPPSEKLNIAGIGIGGHGANDLEELKGENIVALCDVDDLIAAGTLAKYPKAKKYKDFRKMLESMDKDIDAVVIATPDHTHAVIAMMAMKMGKHVYLQKPLAHDIYEVRQLTEAARKYNVATQMGIQLHATDDLKRLVELIRSGVIGKVREVHLWSDKKRLETLTGRPKETVVVPKELDWDLWLGPAPFRPYHPCYAPFNWRYWWDFGSGNLLFFNSSGRHGSIPPSYQVSVIGGLSLWAGNW